MALNPVPQWREKIQQELEKKVDPELLKKLRLNLPADIKEFITTNQVVVFAWNQELISYYDLVVEYVLSCLYLKVQDKEEFKIREEKVRLEMENRKLVDKVKEAKVNELISSIREAGREVTISFSLPAEPEPSKKRP